MLRHSTGYKLSIACTSPCGDLTAPDSWPEPLGAMHARESAVHGVRPWPLRSSPANVCCSPASRSSAAGGNGPFLNSSERILELLRRRHADQDGPHRRMRHRKRRGGFAGGRRSGLRGLQRRCVCTRTLAAMTHVTPNPVITVTCARNVDMQEKRQMRHRSSIIEPVRNSLNAT
jgi:hypothetical protein